MLSSTYNLKKKKKLSGKICIELSIANVEFKKQGHFVKYFEKIGILLHSFTIKDICPFCPLHWYHVFDIKNSKLGAVKVGQNCLYSEVQLLED